MADNNVEFSQFTQRELRQLAKRFSLMGEDAVAEARQTSNSLASMAFDSIKEAARNRKVAAKGTQRMVDGGRVSKTSKTGQLSFGFASQRFSGGATTQMLWPGLEFGSTKFKQFPKYSGRFGKGSRGWVIYPTLREIQPKLTEEWVSAMDKVVKEWPNG